MGISTPTIWGMIIPYYIPSNIAWDLTNGPRSVSCDRAIRYSGLGVRSVGPVGDFLDISKAVRPM